MSRGYCHPWFLRSRQQWKDLSGDVALEATDDLSLLHAFTNATIHILAGPLIVAKPNDHYPIDCGIGLAITSSTESMSIGIA
jgi:hypothetical protein